MGNLIENYSVNTSWLCIISISCLLITVCIQLFDDFAGFLFDDFAGFLSPFLSFHESIEIYFYAPAALTCPGHRAFGLSVCTSVDQVKILSKVESHYISLCD